MVIKFLGTSSGVGFPRPGCQCPQCTSSDSRDKRMRSAILVNSVVLVDAGPDILAQLAECQSVKPACRQGRYQGVKDQISDTLTLDTLIQNLKAVVITHRHEDHIGGLESLLDKHHDLSVFYPHHGEEFETAGLKFLAFRVPHSKSVQTHGLKISEKLVYFQASAWKQARPQDYHGREPVVAYIPDLQNLQSALKYFEGVKVAVVDGSCLNRDFMGHQSMLNQIELLKPNSSLQSIYFTHNGHNRLPHTEVEKIIQRAGDDRFHLAYDRLELKI